MAKGSSRETVRFDYHWSISKHIDRTMDACIGGGHRFWNAVSGVRTLSHPFLSPEQREGFVASFEAGQDAAHEEVDARDQARHVQLRFLIRVLFNAGVLSKQEMPVEHVSTVNLEEPDEKPEPPKRVTFDYNWVIQHHVNRTMQRSIDGGGPFYRGVMGLRSLAEPWFQPAKGADNGAKEKDAVVVGPVRSKRQAQYLKAWQRGAKQAGRKEDQAAQAKHEQMRYLLDVLYGEGVLGRQDVTVDQLTVLESIG